jgi:two-component system response regulator AtoC
MKATVLIVDDDPGMRENLNAILGEHYQMRLAASAEEAYAHLASGEVELALLDLHLHGRSRDRSGFEILESIRREPSRPVGVIMFTVEDEVATAVEAMQLGADHYLSKTCSDEELLIVVKKVLDNVRLQRAYLVAERESQDETDEIIGQSPAIKKILQQVDKIADKEGPVLIVGESGTGKELIARRLHDLSWRKKQKQSFVAINCAAIQKELAESELFGHEPGAFTDARRRRIGKLEFVDQGTLLLDEIDSMDKAVQAKLLRVIEERSFERLGGNQKIVFRGRVVAAAKSALQNAVASGEFREDLYFRLNGLTLSLPPLRNRPEDIPLLAHYFLHKLNRKHGLAIRQIAEEAMASLKAYPWPGNVRQLRNEIERIFDLADSGTSCITVSMLSENLRQQAVPLLEKLLDGKAESLTLPQAMELLKCGMITQALEESNGNITQAANKLGITRRGLQKMRQNLS